MRAGIDLDGDGRSALRATDPAYLGVSLGGVIGGVFAAVEPEIRAAVLNVPGGRLAQFAGSTSSLAVPFLARFATEAGIPMRTCNGEACRFNADFELLLESALPNFQTQLDPGDGISYARGMRIEPDPGDPKAVLIQEGIGDVIVANPLTEALARGIALPVGRPDASVSGTAGLWRFPPPTGHGIFGLPEVRAQAIIFLASGGTFLPAP
jgi:pimeloyl-ACP methyl ester carboxylesterase